jgi:hypothetical protein
MVKVKGLGKKRGRVETSMPFGYGSARIDIRSAREGARMYSSLATYL